MKTATPEVSVIMKAQAIVGTGRSGTQSIGSALMKAFREGFFGGDDI